MYDCDDDDDLLNPAIAEVPRNGVDEDCNGWDLVVRKLVEDFTGLDGWLTSSDWDPPGGAVYEVPAGVRLDPVIIPGQMQKPAVIELDDTLEWTAGVPWVGLEITAWTAPITCKVKMTGGYTEEIDLDGVGTYAFPFENVGDAPIAIDELKVVCSGAGAATFAWLTLSDGIGTTILPPGSRNGRQWFDTNMPGGGASNLILIPTDAGLYAASDVGGVAFSDDYGETWEVRNGVVSAGLERAYDLAVWGLAADPDDPDRVWASTGGEYTLDGTEYRYGGLFESSDGGASWTLLTDEADATNPFAVYGRTDDCVTPPRVALAGGKLSVYVEHPYGSGSDTSDYVLRPVTAPP